MRRGARAAGAAVIVAATALLGSLVPVQAQPVLPFGAPALVGAAPVDVYGDAMATLPDGTVGTAWVSSSSSIHVAIRKPGRASFVELTPLTATVVPPSVPSTWPMVRLVAAGSEFLLAWVQPGSPNTVRAARISAATTAVPSGTVVSGADEVTTGNVAVGATADGSAAIAWQASTPGSLEVHVARRAGLTGGWQALGRAGRADVPYSMAVAIDSSRAVTVAWAVISGPSPEVRVRSYEAGGWGVTLQAAEPSSLAVSTGRVVAAASAGTSTLVAVIDVASGDSGFAGDPASGVRLLQRSTSGAPWTLSAPLVGPGRFAQSLDLAMLPDGSAAVAFQDLEDGFDTSGPFTLSTMVSQRQGAGGAWSVPRLAYTVATKDLSVFSGVAGPLGLAPDGTLLLTVHAPLAVGGGNVGYGLATVWRSGWNGPFVEQRIITEALIPAAVGTSLDAAGRATVAYVTSLANLDAATTATPKPFVRSKAALSTTSPRVGTAVTCKSAWTGAVTLAYAWLRNGSPIGGATAKTYTPKAADRGRSLSCRVKATNPTGATLSTSSARSVS